MPPEPTSAARAFDAPPGAVIAIDESLIADLTAASRGSPRRRMILRLHKRLDARLQRMLNALQPGTYIRPHRHPTPRAESLVLLRGAVRFVAFDDRGGILHVVDLRPGGPVGVDVEPGVWHTLLALVEDSVLFEAKLGPYDADRDKAFAPWAPAEGDPAAASYASDLIRRTEPSR